MTSAAVERTPPKPWYKSAYQILSTTNHAHIGLLYIAASYIFLVIGGLLALLMRFELATPRGNLVDSNTYSSLFTIHGTLMIFFWAMPVFAGLGNYLIPKMIGAPDMYYPKLNALSFWLFLSAGVLLLASWTNIGWTGYTPLSVITPDVGVDLWILSLHVAGTSSMVGSLNFIITTWRLRRSDIGWWRLPLFVWSWVVTAFIVIFAVPVLAFGLTLLLLDRNLGTGFYLPSAGGDTVLWQHLFWFFGHPEVYILVLPAMGVISEILPRLVKKPIVGYRMIALSTVLIAVLSFGVWAHHMFTTGLSPLTLAPFMIMTMLVAIPSGVKVVNWEATMWGGKIKFNTPTIFTIAFIGTFIVGGITGVFHAAIPVDWHIHDTYWVVGHMHFILFGAISQAAFAATYYYFPYLTKRMYSESLGKIHAITANVGQYMVFLSMMLLGLMGMPRRYYGYVEEYQGLHVVATVGAFLIGIGTAFFLLNMLLSWKFGPKADSDPWQSIKNNMPDFLGEYLNELDKKALQPQEGKHGETR
ncbi:MAG: cbb3-type cytochrome c oxidase subunit I [Candidatus Caldarchaeum sp.]|nr:cbb3-type cytochrome c oxidase subunit I [Candidatus Caldarchaeum sp.]